MKKKMKRIKKTEMRELLQPLVGWERMREEPVPKLTKAMTSKKWNLFFPWFQDTD